MNHSALLTEFKAQLNPNGKPILDLASGYGRNGLYLHQQGFPVQFADKNRDSLNAIQAKGMIDENNCFCIDFECGEKVLKPESYQAIIVFRYLHRPLIDQIRDAIQPGGLLIYETFTTQNRQFGRPNRDAFLLQPGELKEMFPNWICLHYFEGIKNNPDRAIAQIVCQKPMC